MSPLDAPSDASSPSVSSGILGWITGVTRRFGWGVSDQVLSSASNFAAGVIVARSVETSEFGAYQIAFTSYLLALGIGKVLGTTPLVIRYSAVDNEAWRRGTSSATGISAAAGATLGLIYALVGAFLLDGPVSGALIALGVCLPGLLIQDSWRFSFFAADRGVLAFVNDLIWTLVAIPLLIAIAFLEGAQASWFILAWGGGATIAAFAGVFQARILPRPGRSLAWIREHRDILGRYIGEFMANTGAMQLSIYLLTSLTSLAVIGALRGATLLFGPLNILNLGVSISTVPEGARALKQSAAKLRRTTLVISLGLAALSLGWGLVLLLIPSGVGQAILGDTWSGARPLMLPLTVMAVGTGATVGALVGLRALGAAKHSFPARLIVSALIVIVPLAGVFLEGGARGIAWGAAVAEVLGAAIWFRYYGKALVHQEDASRTESVGEK